MQTTIGNGTINFGDGTVLSSNTIAWASLFGVKTKLSQFINNLPLPANSISNTGIITTAPGFCSGWQSDFYYLSYSNSNNSLQLVQTNCNCNCNC